MSAEIIQFATVVRQPHAPLPQAIPIGTGGPLAIANHHSRARSERKAAWKRAEIVMNYREHLHDFAFWCEIARDRGLAAALNPPVFRDRMDTADDLNQAVRALLLTPAPDKAALTWKVQRLQRKHRPWALGAATREEVERAIAADREFLKAHPVRSGRQRGA